MTVGVWSREGHATAPGSRLADQDSTWPDRLSLSVHRHPALGGLLEGTLRVGWGRATGQTDSSTSDIEAALWVGRAEVTA